MTHNTFLVKYFPDFHFSIDVLSDFAIIFSDRFNVTDFQKCGDLCEEKRLRSLLCRLVCVLDLFKDFNSFMSDIFSEIFHQGHKKFSLYTLRVLYRNRRNCFYYFLFVKL